jgi:hypothetical protein
MAVVFVPPIAKALANANISTRFLRAKAVNDVSVCPLFRPHYLVLPRYAEGAGSNAHAIQVQD